MMSLRINEALESGFRRTVSREALGFIAVYLVFQAVSTVIIQTFNQQISQQFGVGAVKQVAAMPITAHRVGEAFPFVVDLTLAPLAFGLILTVVITETLTILGVRMFARDTTASVSTAVLRDGLVLATLNGVIGGTIATVATILGLVLFLIPGVFIAISLFFVRQEIAVKDKNFIDALTGSWDLTRGARLNVFGLAALLFVMNLLASSPAMVLFFLDPIVATVLGVVVGSIVTVFVIAVTTRAYIQLDGGSTPPADSAGATESSEYVSTTESQD